MLLIYLKVNFLPGPNIARLESLQADSLFKCASESGEPRQTSKSEPLTGQLRPEKWPNFA